jgi:hypothetical protein
MLSLFVVGVFLAKVLFSQVVYQHPDGRPHLSLVPPLHEPLLVLLGGCLHDLQLPLDRRERLLADGEPVLFFLVLAGWWVGRAALRSS